VVAAGGRLSRAGLLLLGVGLSGPAACLVEGLSQAGLAKYGL